ncbi:MAG: hypothetical protein ACK5BB_06640 [Burkholderiaceae bacterium]
MQPLSHGPTINTSVPTEGSAHDRRLLIDIDFFDEEGRWNPRKVLFCASDRTERASSLWTRCFGGLMSLHAMLWVKNYLKTQFPELEQSKNMIKQINKTGFVDEKNFIETAIHCSMLAQEQAKLIDQEKLAEAHPMTANPLLKNIGSLVSKYITRIDWSTWGEGQFQQMTLTMAVNIRDFLKNLPIEERNHSLVEALNAMMNRYLEWLGDPPEGVDSDALSSGNKDDMEYRVYEIRNTIHEAITLAIMEYEERRKKEEPITSLVEKIDAEIYKWDKKRFGSLIFAFQLKESGLVDYLRRGRSGFVEGGDLKKAKIIVELPIEKLRLFLNFLDESEFSFLQKRFEQFRIDMPAISIEIQRIEASLAKSAATKSTFQASAQ